MMRLRLGVLGVLLASSAALGCGGASGGTCASGTACGGDIVGTWAVTSSCISETITGGQCAGGTQTVAGTVTGTITYGADLTYNQNFVLIATQTASVPTACLVSGTITLTCDQFRQQILTSGAYTTATCSPTSGGCACTGSINRTAQVTGTYTTTGSGLLTTTSSTGGVSNFDFCAKGTTLTLSPHLTPTATATVTASGALDLTKQ
jgi:hypothetical protein